MPAGYNALTLRGKALLPVLSMSVRVAPPLLGPGNQPAKTRDCTAIWDTGAMGTVITQAVVDDLGLKPTGLMQVHTANGTRMCEVCMVSLLLPNGVNIDASATVADVPSCDVLIGMDVITLGDFSVTNFNGKTTMSFRIPSQSDVDFVKRAHAADTVAAEGKPKLAPPPPAPQSRHERRHPDKPNPKRRKH